MFASSQWITNHLSCKKRQQLFVLLHSCHVGAPWMGTNIASHTELYTFMSYILANNTSAENPTGLELEQSVHLSIF